ncbi:MAG: ABC transporter substrate-binding protein [bacterium]|nr:ABC transporter substrate-binding protein [bacterium]
MSRRAHRWYLVLAIGLALVLAVGGCVFKKAAQGEKTPIIIGIATSLTGGGAGSGNHIWWGAQLAVDDLNAAGGVGGREVKLVVEDDATSPAQAVSAVNALIMQQKVDAIIGGNWSSLAMPVIPVVEREGVPFIVTSASTPAITAPGRQWTFRLHQSDATAASQAANFIINTLKLTEIAVMHDTGDYGTGCKDFFVAAGRMFGVKPLTVEPYNTGDKDFTAQLVKIRASGAKALGLFGVYPEVSLITLQARDLGMNDLKIVMTGISQQAYIDLAPGASEGVYAVTPFNAEVDDPEVRDFAQRYRARFQLDPPHQASNTYQAIVRVLAPIWAEVGTADKTAVRDAIRKSTWDAFGQTGIHFGADHQVSMKSIIIQVTNGRFVVTPH